MQHHKFGTTSLERLSTCHEALQMYAHVALKLSPVDVTVLCGWRGEDAQNAAYRLGNSKFQWPESTHNHLRDGKPYSLGVDLAPWMVHGIPWKDTHVFAVVAGAMFAARQSLVLHYPYYRWPGLRWGADWDRDGHTLDHSFRDYGHFELIGPPAVLSTPAFPIGDVLEGL